MHQNRPRPSHLTCDRSTVHPTFVLGVEREALPGNSYVVLSEAVLVLVIVIEVTVIVIEVTGIVPSPEFDYEHDYEHEHDKANYRAKPPERERELRRAHRCCQRWPNVTARFQCAAAARPQRRANEVLSPEC